MRQMTHGPSSQPRAFRSPATCQTIGPAPLFNNRVDSQTAAEAAFRRTWVQPHDGRGSFKLRNRNHCKQSSRCGAMALVASLAAPGRRVDPQPPRHHGLRIQGCRRCGVSRNCISYLIPGWGTPHAPGRPKKKKKKKITANEFPKHTTSVRCRRDRQPCEEPTAPQPAPRTRQTPPSQIQV